MKGIGTRDGDIMKLPVRVISDLNPGHQASRIFDVEKLRPLFRGAGTVLFNGDTWEGLSPPWKEKFCETYLPRAEILVCGYFHCKGIRNAYGKTVINTGSFVVPGPAGWVE
jgi:hypothetical protein